MSMKTILENWNSYLKEDRWKYRVLSETAFSRIVTDYGERGYIVITSDRSCKAETGRDCSDAENAEQDNVNAANMKQLQSDLRSSGFGYIPTLGGYKEDLIDPETGDPVHDDEGKVVKVDTERPENSVIVVARPKKGKDHNVLKQLGMELARKYNQDSFFYKPPNEEDEGAHWIKSDGSVDMSFDKFTVNDLEQEFYTMMARGPKHRFTALDESEAKREMFFRVRISPSSTSEARQRYGEVFLRFE